jgi:SAM-dependent methyltransferase
MTPEVFMWNRQSPMVARDRAEEIWSLEREGKTYSIPVDVCFSKALDIAKIKREWPYQREIDFNRKRMDFFKEAADFVDTKMCPVCSSPKGKASKLITISGVEYLECGTCSHLYAAYFPSPSLVERYYRENAIGNPYYMNPAEIELRLEEIYLPKIRWICREYNKIFGTEPRNILDIGAGAGHFLAGCRRLGLEVAGIEFSKPYREWCMEHFGVQLSRDKGELGGRTFDIVCSFNVIEHTHNPNAFVSDHKEFLREKSMVVIETPRANSFTTWIQKMFPDEPRCHIVPYEHNHLFTDASLATLLFIHGLAIRSVWYYGQDMVELILRMCAELKADSSQVLPKFYGPTQQAVDIFHGSDLMLVIAVAMEG